MVPPFFRASQAWLAIGLLGLLAGGPRSAAACPFCVAVQPTLAQQRESADVVALGELREVDANEARFRLHQVVAGTTHVPGETTTIAQHFTNPPGTLFLLIGRPPVDADEAWSWQCTPVTETSWGYFVRAPSLRQPASERLRYFARYLEHPEALIAADALMEFAHASYDDVASMSDALPMEALRRWIVDEGVAGERKGFYGLALGLAPAADDQRINRRLLWELIERPADDFRAGFDGILGGYLVLAGESGLDAIEERFLADRQSADGDVRHVMSALRFYYEFGDEIAAERLQSALRRLLERPEFTAAAVTDLARWQDWSLIDRMPALFERDDAFQSATRRAAVGYLLACPQAAASDVLNNLRAAHPREVATVEQRLSILGGAF